MDTLVFNLCFDEEKVIEFEFAIIDLTCTRSMGNKTNELLGMVGCSEDFELVCQVPNNFFMFEKL